MLLVVPSTIPKDSVNEDQQTWKKTERSFNALFKDFFSGAVIALVEMLRMVYMEIRE
jgi:hypothetical protein